MIVRSIYFPFKRPPRSICSGIDFIFDLLIKFFSVLLISLFVNYQLVETKDNINKNPRHHLLNASLTNDLSRKDDQNLYQPWKYVYSNSSAVLRPSETSKLIQLVNIINFTRHNGVDRVREYSKNHKLDGETTGNITQNEDNISYFLKKHSQNHPKEHRGETIEEELPKVIKSITAPVEGRPAVGEMKTKNTSAEELLISNSYINTSEIIKEEILPVCGNISILSNEKNTTNKVNSIINNPNQRSDAKSDHSSKMKNLFFSNNYTLLKKIKKSTKANDSAEASLTNERTNATACETNTTASPVEEPPTQPASGETIENKNKLKSAIFETSLHGAHKTDTTKHKTDKKNQHYSVRQSNASAELPYRPNYKSAARIVAGTSTNAQSNSTSNVHLMASAKELRSDRNYTAGTLLNKAMHSTLSDDRGVFANARDYLTTETTPKHPEAQQSQDKLHQDITTYRKLKFPAINLTNKRRKFIRQWETYETINSEITQTEERTAFTNGKGIHAPKAKRTNTLFDPVKMRDNVGPLSDEGDFGGRRTQADKSSTLLGPLDLSPLISKIKNKDFHKPQEKKEYLAQIAFAHEMTATKNTYRDLKTAALPTQPAETIERTTNSIPSGTDSLKITVPSNKHYEETTVEIASKNVILESVPAEENKQETNQSRSKTTLTESNTFENASFGLETTSPVIDRVESYHIEYSNTSRIPLKVENLFFNDTVNPTTCIPSEKNTNCLDVTEVNTESSHKNQLTEPTSDDKKLSKPYEISTVKNIDAKSNVTENLIFPSKTMILNNETYSSTQNTVAFYIKTVVPTFPSTSKIETSDILTQRIQPTTVTSNSSIKISKLSTISTTPFAIDTIYNHHTEIVINTTQTTTSRPASQSRKPSENNPPSGITHIVPHRQEDVTASTDINFIRLSTRDFSTEPSVGAFLTPSDITLPQTTARDDKPTSSVDEIISDYSEVNSSLPNSAMSSNGSEAVWPVKLASVVEGDIILGGLMMVHSREDSVTCGPIMPQGGVQALEAMLYTLDRLNSDPHFMPNVTLGAHILDDCDKDTYGLEMAVDFIKGSISNIDGAEYHCNKTQVKKVISGVVGAASSVTSIQVANLLRLFKIPQVSFFSTSPELSNKQRFEYFTRTIPSDHYQVKAMVDIVRELGWSYVSIIYEESNYGIKAFEELEGLLSKYNICIAVKEKLVKDSGVALEIAYDNIVQKLLTKPRARGVIIFGSDQEVAGMMRAVRRLNATGAFSWIGSDGWSARSLVSDGSEPEVEGTLSVQPQANPVRGFEEYFLALTVDNNERNPWFVEFWEDHFHCRYPNSSLTPFNQKYTNACTGREKLTRQNTDFEDQLQFVSDAVMAFAYAIRDMHKELCRGRPGLCDAMKPTKGPELLRYLRKVQFEGLSGDHFRFDGNGDGPARYNIIHFKQVSPGKHRWIKVGEYLEGELKLNMTEIQFKLSQPKPPESVCSLPCDQGQAKQYVEGESCCWHCFNCTQYQIRHPQDETQCVLCPRGTVPDAGRVRCRDIPEVFLRPGSSWAIGAMALSSTGILVTLFVAGVFLRHNDTPVVRASGRELSYVLLVGILMCYCVTFALVIRPSDLVCGIQRFGAGFCFTVVYAALLTKTNRISRIFNAGKQSAKRPSLISPRSQLIICSGLIGIQVVINGVWMVISPARAMHHYPTREDNLLVCDSYVDASYMIAFSYPIVLIVVCTVYAVLTRKIPEAFNESKHIGFTMYTTCVIWLAFVPLYFGTGNHVPLRITSMSVTISLSASVTVACLFSPKLYIILIRPERNVRQSMMPVRFSAINKSSGTANSGAGSMMAAVVVTAATCNQKEKINKQLPPADPDMELKKKVKLEDRSTQTDVSLNNENGTPVSANGISSFQNQYQKNNSSSSELQSPQSVIVKLNNNNTSILCAVKPTIINRSSASVNNLAATIMPSDIISKGDSSPLKSVSFIDERSAEEPAPPRRPTALASNSHPHKGDSATSRSTAGVLQDAPDAGLVSNAALNNLIGNSQASGAIGNGPAVPSNLSQSSVRDIAL